MEQDWKRQVRREASEHHMCAENRTALGSTESKHEAVELYKATASWALENSYPSLDTIRRHFSDCGDDGVFVDRDFEGELLADHQVYVFHNCSGTIRVGLNIDKAIIPILHFANGCHMTVVVEGGVRVPVHIFGDNKVEADAGCYIRKHELKNGEHNR